MRLAVTGGREYGDQQRVDEALDAIHAATPLDILIHGDCPDRPGKPRSADQMAADWARRRGIPLDPYPADWENIDAVPCRIAIGKNRRPYNVLAGLNRNIRMLLQAAPQVVAVFPGGNGTAHCRAQALRRGIAVMDVDA